MKRNEGEMTEQEASLIFVGREALNLGGIPFRCQTSRASSPTENA